MSKFEAVKSLTKVSNQLVYEADVRRNVSLTLNLFPHLWEVLTLSLEIFFENVQLHLEGADIFHHITDRIFLTLQL